MHSSISSLFLIHLILYTSHCLLCTLLPVFHLCAILTYYTVPYALIPTTHPYYLICTFIASCVFVLCLMWCLCIWYIAIALTHGLHTLCIFSLPYILSLSSSLLTLHPALIVCRKLQRVLHVCTKRKERTHCRERICITGWLRT
jgi:hypothetical protein